LHIHKAIHQITNACFVVADLLPSNTTVSQSTAQPTSPAQTSMSISVQDRLNTPSVNNIDKEDVLEELVLFCAVFSQ